MFCMSDLCIQVWTLFNTGHTLSNQLFNFCTTEFHLKQAIKFHRVPRGLSDKWLSKSIQIIKINYICLSCFLRVHCAPFSGHALFFSFSSVSCSPSSESMSILNKCWVSISTGNNLSTVVWSSEMWFILHYPMQYGPILNPPSSESPAPGICSCLSAGAEEPVCSLYC